MNPSRFAGGSRVPRRFWPVLAAAAVAVGLGWRLSNAWTGRGASAPCALPEEEYFLSSVLLLSEHVYTRDPGGAPQARHGPLYPTFLALTQAGASRPSPRRACLAQAVLGFLAALAAWGLGARLRSPAAGALAAAAVALTPALARSVVSLNVHGFYGVVVLLLACAAAEWARRDGDRASGAVLGAALGVSLLCRTAHLAAVPLLVAAAWAWRGRDGLKRAAWALAVAAAVLVPWTVRNYVHTRRLVLLDTGIGAYNLLAAADGKDGADTIAQAFATADRVEPDFSSRHLAEPSPQREDALAAVARTLILRSPGSFARGCLRRLIGYWRPLWPLVLLTLIAAFLPGAAPGTRAAALLAASFSLYAVIGLGVDYRLDVEPLLAALAGVGLASLLERAPRPSLERASLRAMLPAAAAVGLAALACLAFTPLDAWAARRSGQPRCDPPSPFLAAFLDDGISACGAGWSQAHWAGTLRARPAVCAGMAAFSSGEPASAARRFDEAAVLAPLDPEIRLSLAVALGAAGDKARARRECAEAERLISGDPSPSLDELRSAVRSTRESLSKK